MNLQKYDADVIYASYIALKASPLYIHTMETSRDRFKRLATIRTNAILHRLKVLGNCANKQLYEYDERDIEKVFSEIEKKVRETKSKFHFTKKQDKFHL